MLEVISHCQPNSHLAFFSSSSPGTAQSSSGEEEIQARDPPPVGLATLIAMYPTLGWRKFFLPMESSYNWSRSFIGGRV